MTIYLSGELRWKSRHVLNVCPLIMCEIMRSKDAQCTTKEWR